MSPTTTPVSTSRYPTSLQLSFDVNKTVVGIDTSKGMGVDAVIRAMLAEYTIGVWAVGLPSMSFKEYAETVLHPDDKVKGKKEIQGFITWLETNRHSQEAEVKATMVRLESSLKDTEELERIGPKVFESFYRLLDALKAAEVAHTVILRTFGEDGPAVARRITYDTKDAVQFPMVGSFRERQLTIEGVPADVAEGRPGTQILIDPKDIFYLFKRAAHTGFHTVVKDDFEAWNRAGKIGEYGKRVYFDGRTTCDLSLFFDDNLEKRTHEKPHRGIACAVEINGMADSDGFDDLFHQVNSMEAVLNPRYYIERMNGFLAARGFSSI